jgi:CRISPR-associated protein Cmr6
MALHPAGGFAYLPATGLKGLARSYATVLARTAPDVRTQLARVFGSISDDEQGGSAGSVVFHDALPMAVPALLVDIVNPHFKGFYEGKGAPDGTSEPEPAYFPSVRPGTAFQFFLHARHKGAESDSDVETAMIWLKRALEECGAGAKTSSGFGRFRFEGAASAIAIRKTAPFSVKLITPAFLAGAEQYGEASRAGAALRGAGLRGQLRWWWRTLHAAHLGLKDLLRLERLVWGGLDFDQSAETQEPAAYSSRVDVIVVPDGQISVSLFDPKQGGSRLDNLYVAYGMQEITPADAAKDKKGQPHEARLKVAPGAKWTVTLSVRGPGEDESLTAEEIMNEARAALMLLLTFGGVGAKWRHGFGRLEALGPSTDMTLEKAKDNAKKLRARFSKQAGSTDSPSIESMVEVEIGDLRGSPDQLMANIGKLLRESTRVKGQDKRERSHLGLPRTVKIAGRNVDLAASLGIPRHPSPQILVPTLRQDGKWNLAVVIFPSKILKSEGLTNHAFFSVDTAPIHKERLLQAAKIVGFAEAGTSPPGTQNIPPSVVGSSAKNVGPQRRNTLSTRAGAPNRVQAAPVAAKPLGPKNGDILEAELLEEKTQKGSWRARHIESGRTGYLLNTADVVADAKAGDKVKLIAHAVPMTGEITFRWPVAAPPKK